MGRPGKRAEPNEVSRRADPLAWLLLLPAAVLAWPGPGAPLADDPYPHLAATGLVALFIVPAALLAVRGPGRALRGITLWTTLWALAALAVGFGHPTDSFEARRSLTHLGMAAVALVAGAELRPGGRETFLRGTLVLSLVWVLGAFAIDLLGAGHLAGILGNTGTLSQAALVGAAVGAWFLALRRGPWKLLGALGVLAFVAHAALTPVLGGALALTGALTAAALVSAWAQRRARVRRRFGLLAALSLFALLALRDAGPPHAGTAEARGSGSDAMAPADLGGVEVRLRTWERVPALIASAPLLGIGPGQFQARFPPFRDPREIEISRHGACSELSTEVEHAHDDYLEGLAELGLVGGTLWIAFLFLVARAALRALRDEDVVAGAAGTGALALLVNSLFHAPLLFNPAAAVLGFALFGILLGRDAPPGAARTSRLLRAEVAFASVLAIPVFAWPAIEHGRALRDGIQASKALDALGHAPIQTEEQQTALLAAIHRAARSTAESLWAAPDSTPAAILRARQSSADVEESAWMAVLERRPHSVEALEHMGVALAREGHLDRARVYLAEALALSPTHPRLLRQLLRLELLDGDVEAGEALLERLRATGCLDAGWPVGLGAELVLEGLLGEGALLLFGRPLDELVPEELYADAQACEEADPDRAGALSTLAHVLWARDQVSQRDYATAVRSYRQAWNATRAHGQGAPGLRLELAAAELLAERTPEDVPRTAGAEGERTWSRLPSWARATLEHAGFHPEP